MSALEVYVQAARAALAAGDMESYLEARDEFNLLTADLFRKISIRQIWPDS